MREILLSKGGLTARVIPPCAELSAACGSRFDLSGIIRQIRFAGHTFFSCDPEKGLLGTAEEFSTLNPPGFASAACGGEFSKIGAGLFSKNRATYTQYQPYECLHPADWSVNSGSDWIDFENVEAGWIYRKRIELTRDRLTIFRTLENRGDEILSTDHYGHNFLQIDETPTGLDYQIHFNGPLSLNEARSRTMNLVGVDGQTVSLKNNLLADQSVMLYFQSLEKHPQCVSIMNKKTGATVSIETSLPVSEWRLFVTSHCLCPEPFVQLVVDPGGSAQWQTSYRFSVS